MEGKKDLRLLYFSDELYTERDSPSKSTFWNNLVPKLQDHVHTFCLKRLGYKDWKGVKG